MKGGIKFNVARFHKAVLGVLVGYKPLPFVFIISSIFEERGFE